MCVCVYQLLIKDFSHFFSLEQVHTPWPVFSRHSKTGLTYLYTFSSFFQGRQWHPTPPKIPWMEEPGGLQSMGSLRVGHEWATSLSLFTFMHWRRQWQPTPVFLPGESQGLGWTAVYGVAQSRTRLKWFSSNSSSFFPSKWDFGFTECDTECS